MVCGVNGYTLVMDGVNYGVVKKDGKVLFKGSWNECEEFARTH